MAIFSGPSERLVLAALAAAALAAIAALSEKPPRSVVAKTPVPSSNVNALGPSLCPPGSLPDNGVCIPVPSPERAGSGATAESIPRRPDRPADYSRYVLPVEHAASIAELGERRAADGGLLPSGIGIGVDPSTPVIVPALDGQDGPSRVVYEGVLWGPTVVTLHTVRAGGATEQYLVALGGLGSFRPRTAGDTVERGAELGKTGNSELVLEARLLRPGIDVRPLGAAAMLSDAVSVPTDVRNVLGTK